MQKHCTFYHLVCRCIDGRRIYQPVFAEIVVVRHSGRWVPCRPVGHTGHRAPGPGAGAALPPPWLLFASLRQWQSCAQQHSWSRMCAGKVAQQQQHPHSPSLPHKFSNNPPFPLLSAPSTSCFGSTAYFHRRRLLTRLAAHLHLLTKPPFPALSLQLPHLLSL